jgi:hypothetical protein
MASSTLGREILALLMDLLRPRENLLRRIDLSCSPKTDTIWIGVVLSIAC